MRVYWIIIVLVAIPVLISVNQRHSRDAEVQKQVDKVNADTAKWRRATMDEFYRRHPDMKPNDEGVPVPAKP